MSTREPRIAVVGAGDLQSKAMLEALVAGGCKAAQFLPLGARLGAVEVDLSEDESAEVFLPLDREHVAEARIVVLFSSDPEARAAVAGWVQRDRQLLVDLSAGSEPLGGWLDPLSAAHGAAGEEAVAVPEAAALYVSRLLGHLPGQVRGPLSAQVLLPASRFGEPGVLELFKQAMAVLAFKPVPAEVLTRQLAFNCWPALADGGASLFPAQVRQLAGMPQLPVSCVALQAGSFHSTALSMTLGVTDAHQASPSLTESLSRDEVFQDWTGGEWPSVMDAAGSGRPLAVARPLDPDTLWVWMVFDNAKAGKGALAARWILGRLG